VNPLNVITDSECLAIAHRQWMRANRIKEYFQQALEHTDKQTLRDVQKFYLSDAGIFMVLWYSLLFSTLEGLQSNHVDMKILDPDYDELHKRLKRFRNSVFHTEKQYWDMRQFELMQVDSVVRRIHYIHDRLGESFLEVMREKKK
jgi:hypothetical protein